MAAHIAYPPGGMSRSSGGDVPPAVVLGGGIAGLAVARLLTRHHTRVLVLERDPQPEVASPEDAFTSWARPGVLNLYRAADFVRLRRREAFRIRDAATVAGDSPETWEALDHAARLDLAAFMVEAALDGVAMGRHA